MADPSDTELEVLKLFWRDGELSAREVHDRIGPGLGWAGSTTRTVLERMGAKGLIERSEGEGPAIYRAAQTKVDVLGRALRKFTREVLEIEGPVPAAAFTGSQILNDDDLAELQAMLDDEGDAQ